MTMYPRTADLTQELAKWTKWLEELDDTVAQLTAVLPLEQSQQFLRLMVALDIKQGNPLLPIILVLHLYSQYLQDLSQTLRASGSNLNQTLPAAIKTAGDTALQKALASYNQIQTEIDTSVAAIDASVAQISGICENFSNDVKNLLPKFKSTFAMMKQDAVVAYEADLKKRTTAFLQEHERELEKARRTYRIEVMKQGVLYASRVMVLSLLATGGMAYALGLQYGRHTTMQAAYQAFQGEATYNFAKDIMNRADNTQRFIKCIDDDNAKCTIWIKEPPQPNPL